MSAIGEPDDDLAEVHVGVKAGEQRDQDHRRRETPQPFAPAPFFSAFRRSRRMAAHDTLYDPSNIAFFKVNRPSAHAKSSPGERSPRRPGFRRVRRITSVPRNRSSRRRGAVAGTRGARAPQEELPA